jgi:hypothetical protein
MWFRTLLASWKSGRSGSLRPRPKRRYSRLALEHLEDRSLPSTYSAATVSGLIADINAANKAGGANTIILTAPTNSLYALTTVNNTTDGPTGLPVIGGGKKADYLTIVGNGDTIERSALNTADFRLLAVASNGSLTLKNVTLTGGYATVDGDIGGGAVCNQGTLILDDVTVSDNEITGVPGTANQLGDVMSPSYAGVGGGVWSSGSLTVKDGTVLVNNIAMGSVATVSTALYSEFPSSAMGGGIYIAGGNATINNSTITGNEAVTPQGFVNITTGGGGIYIAGGNATISNSTIIGNEAVAPGGYLDITGGGGIYIAGGNATITNTTITGDKALAPQYYQTTGGGGIYVAGGNATITNTTITGNEAVDPQGGLTTNWGGGGGIFIAGGIVYVDAFTVANTINNTDGSGQNGSTANIDGSYTLLS